MATTNGTLRLVAANPEPTSVGMGTPATDAAFSSFKTEVQKLAALINQLSNTALSNQLSSTLTAFDGYYAAVNAAMAAPAPAAPAQGTVPLSVLQDAETLINQLRAELSKVGYTFTPNAPAGTPPANMTTSPAPGTTPPGTFTTGQVASVGIGGALLGWLGHGLWEDYEHKHGRAR